MSAADHTHYYKTSTDFVLATAVMHGRKVATLDSVRRAVLKLATGYEVDGEADVALAFRMFADSLTDEPAALSSEDATRPTPTSGSGPGCKNHRGDPHNLCEACWELEPHATRPTGDGQ